LRNELTASLKRRAVKSVLDMIILRELKKHPTSGYELQIAIFGKYDTLLSSGTVYSRIYALERGEYIKGRHVRRRRVYSLTTHGEAALKPSLSSRNRFALLIRNLFQ